MLLRVQTRSLFVSIIILSLDALLTKKKNELSLLQETFLLEHYVQMRQKQKIIDGHLSPRCSEVLPPCFCFPCRVRPCRPALGIISPPWCSGSSAATKFG